MWYDEKVLCQKKKSLPRREENEDLSVLPRDHPLNSSRQKISRRPSTSLVAASAQALSGLPDAGATMRPCQARDLPWCVWCSPSFLFFCGGIIKRGNGVGRTEWRRRDWTEQMDAAVNYVELLMWFFFLTFSWVFLLNSFSSGFILKVLLDLHSEHAMRKYLNKVQTMS